MICNLVSCLDVGQLMLFSLSNKFKNNFWTKRKTFILLSLILKRLSVEYPIKYFGGLCVLKVFLNGLVLMFKQCIMVQSGCKVSGCTSRLDFHYSFKSIREFRASCPWEVFYGDDLVLVAKTLDLWMGKLKL